MAMNGLERITNKILAEARRDADRIAAEADAEAARIRADYAARADEIRAMLSDAAQREGNDMIARAKAEATKRKKDRMLAVRSRMVDESFDAALANFRRMPAEGRIPFLSGLLAAALLEQIDTEVRQELYGDEETTAFSKYEVIFNARDREAVGAAVLEDARKRLASRVDAERLKLLALSEQTASIDGGLILRVGSIEVNCSLTLLFAQLREELEGEVSHALFGGA